MILSYNSLLTPQQLHNRMLKLYMEMKKDDSTLMFFLTKELLWPHWDTITKISSFCNQLLSIVINGNQTLITIDNNWLQKLPLFYMEWAGQIVMPLEVPQPHWHFIYLKFKLYFEHLDRSVIMFGLKIIPGRQRKVRSQNFPRQGFQNKRNNTQASLRLLWALH